MSGFGYSWQGKFAGFDATDSCGFMIVSIEVLVVSWQWVVLAASTVTEHVACNDIVLQLQCHDSAKWNHMNQCQHQ